MSKDLTIRQGDIVRIREAAVAKVDEDGTLILKINMGLGFAYTITTLHRAAIEEILYHSETPEEELERLRAENAKWQRVAEALRKKKVGHKIEWKGGECPVDDQMRVVVWRDNGVITSDRAGCFRWQHEHQEGWVNLVAYMVLPE